jgi:hypothetical protein
MSTRSREVAELGSGPTVLEAPTTLRLRMVQVYGALALGSFLVFLCTFALQGRWIQPNPNRHLLTAGETAVAALLAIISAALACWSFRCIRAGGRATARENKIADHTLSLPVVVRMSGRVRLVIDEHELELPSKRSAQRVHLDEIAAVDWDAWGIQLRLRNGALIEVPLARPPRGSFLRTTFHEIDVITRSIALAALGFNERIATLISQLVTSSGRPYRSRQIGTHA